MNRLNRFDKPDWVPPRSSRLLDQVRERIRYLHYSLQTEKVYVYWTKAFVLWAARSGGGFTHPREMGQAEVEGFLTMLATEKQVSPATHRQALNALLFLCRHVLGTELPWMNQMGRPPARTQAHSRGADGCASASGVGSDAWVEGALARWLDGTGMRLSDGLSLKVKALKVAAGGTASPLDALSTVPT